MVKFKDIVKNNSGTLYVSIPKKSARSINIKEGDSVIVNVTKEVKK